MKWWIIPAVLLGLYLAVSVAVFWLACVRRKEDTRPIEQRVDPLWAQFKEEVFEGVRWFRAMNPEPVEILSHDGLHLKGNYLAHPAPRGTILLFHGYRTDGHVDFCCAYRYYYEQGFSLLSVYERAHVKSEGRYITFGVKERQDCLRWAEYAAKRFGADHVLILDGMSMGASTVLMASELPLPESVKGIIADSGFTSAWEEIGYLMKKLHIPCPAVLLFGADLVARAVAGFSFRECSTVAAMKNNTRPVLLLHGDADDFVPACFSEACYAACRTEKELHIIRGADHGTGYLVDLPLCQDALQRFLNKCTEERHA